MCKSEIFAKILRIVSKETEVSEDLILSKCKRSDIVDSRGIMVVILSEYKFSESQISSFTGFTQQSINKLKNIYPDRIRRNYLLKAYSRNGFFAKQVVINMEFCGCCKNCNNHTPLKSNNHVSESSSK